jgi:hypothetical protein
VFIIHKRVRWPLEARGSRLGYPRIIASVVYSQLKLSLAKKLFLFHLMKPEKIFTVLPKRNYSKSA